MLAIPMTSFDLSWHVRSMLLIMNGLIRVSGSRSIQIPSRERISRENLLHWPFEDQLIAEIFKFREGLVFLTC